MQGEFDRAFENRTPDQTPYAPPPTSGDAVWARLTEIARQRVLDSGIALSSPFAPEVEQDVLGDRPAGQTSGGFDGGAGPPLAQFSASMPSPVRPAVVPPTPDALPAFGQPDPSQLTGFDPRAVADGASQVQTGPTLDDFATHGTVPGFGDPVEDPYGVELRRRLTALLRSG